MSDFKPDKLVIYVISYDRFENEVLNKLAEIKKKQALGIIPSTLIPKEVGPMCDETLYSLPESIRRKYFDVSTFKDGDILILDRINDRYYPANTAADLIPQNRDRAIDHIASLLGAKTIERKVISTEVRKREFTTNGEIKAWAVKGSASYSESEKQKEGRK